MKRLAVGLVLAALAPASALAVESGTGAYLLGTRGLAAGFVPGPGVYISDSIIFLQSRTRQVPAKQFADMPVKFRGA